MQPPSKVERPLRILVTGSSGFTGAALLAVLRSRGHTVFGLTRTPAAVGEIYADLLDRPSIEAALKEASPEVVVHLAGITFPAHPSPVEIYEANVLGGLNLLEALSSLSKSPELILIASSATVYGSAFGVDISENDPLLPTSHYGVSKRTLEDLVRLYRERLPIQITRPFNYTGPGQPPQFFVPKVVDHFARDAGVIEVGNLDLFRDISALDDVLEAYVRLIENGMVGEPLNLCSGGSVRLRDVITMLADISGRKMEVRVAQRFVRAGEPESVVGSRARLDAAIGAWPRESMSSLLERMYEAAVGDAGV